MTSWHTSKQSLDKLAYDKTESLQVGIRQEEEKTKNDEKTMDEKETKKKNKKKKTGREEGERSL